MEKIFRVCILAKKKVNSEGKFQRRERMVIKEVGQHLGKAKKIH